MLLTAITAGMNTHSFPRFGRKASLFIKVWKSNPTLGLHQRLIRTMLPSGSSLVVFR